MSFTVVIPARYDSTRLPGKALANIHGKTMIEHVVDRANESNAHRVIVATDDRRIEQQLLNANCEVCMTRADHESGSDRLAEVVEKIAFDENHIIVNVQGDEPLIPGKLINQVAASLAKSDSAVMSTAAKKILTEEDLHNPNVVKVVSSLSGRALYFSRAPIPFARDQRHAPAWHHIGIYAYKAGFLKQYHLLDGSQIEQTESLEQLRVLDNGYDIMVHQVDYDTGVGVDTPEDLEHIRSLLVAH